MKVRCEFCKKRMAPQGIPSHVSRKHRGMVLAKFRMSTALLIYDLVHAEFLVPRMQLALPAPNPLTIYSRRPLGRMASPIPEHRRPKGYQLPYGYMIPALSLMGNRYYGRNCY